MGSTELKYIFFLSFVLISKILLHNSGSEFSKFSANGKSFVIVNRKREWTEGAFESLERRHVPKRSERKILAQQNLRAFNRGLGILARRAQ